MAQTFVDSILKPNELYAGNSATYDLTYGGQMGFMPRIGMIGPDGRSYGEWISNQAYIRRNIIPVLIQAPRFFELMPGTEGLIRTFKSLIEEQALSIDGLTSTLTVDTDSHPVGGAGEEQEEPTNVTRAKSSLSFTFKEHGNRSVQKFLEFLITYGIMDPDTKRPNVASYFQNLEDINNMYTPDFYSATILFLEPDITFKKVTDAWLCTNCFPKSGGDHVGKRDIKTAGEIPEYNIEFSCLTMHNEAVIRFADVILQGITKVNKIPDLDMILPVSDIEPNVKAQDSGFNAR